MPCAETIDAAFQGRIGALRLDATFSLPARGVTALFGPSGAGKTSLLRCLAGLERVPGRLRVDGEVWQDARTFRPAWRRSVGFVFQDPALLGHLDVRGNLRFGLDRNRGPARIGFDDTVALLGLSALLDRPVARLSGGEGRRVAIGRALLSQPRLLLLDEPLAGLDGEAKAEILAYLKQLEAASGLPMILVSHDPAEVAALARRVLPMQGGRVGPVVAPPAVVPDAARAALAQADPERVAGLALAALLAGLDPV
jgi:molybdate transport system ATP-binding protein